MTNPAPAAALPPAIDPRQLASIERVHGGFLYQHLYVVGSLLMAADSGAHLFVTERDEDVEFFMAGAALYVQIKTRNRPLVPSDLETFWTRVDVLRAAHASRAREGTASFLLLANVPPGPTLATEMASERWPGDVAVAWPDRPAVPPGLPPPWVSVDEALAWCIARARQVPGTRLEPETLVLKLAALAQVASAGGAPTGAPHAFQAAALPGLFEQIVRELHAFPQPPTPYRPHAGEPAYDAGEAARLVVGHSGAGKTAWAAQAAASTAESHVYFDAAGADDVGLATALAEQLLPALLGDTPGGVAAVYRPGATGLDSLRAISLEVERRGTSPVVVIDNAHEVGPEALTTALRASPRMRWVLLAQPGLAAQTLAARLDVVAETLSGWTADTIAREFQEAGVPIDPGAAERVRVLTGGLPLFVRGAARLGVSAYGGDVARLCQDLEGAAHVEATHQEILLDRTIREISREAGLLMEAMALAGVPLVPGELQGLVRGIGGIDERAVGQALRELHRWGISRSVGEGRLDLHDAFRLPARAGIELTVEARYELLRRLVRLLDPAAAERFELARIRRYLGVLAEAGDHARLAEIAGNESETLQEHGLASFMESLLGRLSQREDLPPSTRFWYLDALAFWHVQAERADLAEPLIREMARLLGAEDLGPRAKGALLMKDVHLRALAGEVAELLPLQREVEQAGLEESVQLVLEYNVATGLLRAGQPAEVERITSKLGQRYFEKLGLEPLRIVGRSGRDVWEMIHAAGGDIDDAKRLADCLALHAQAVRLQGRLSGLARVHAAKLYQVARAFRSAVRTGQDLVEELLEFGDPEGALQFIDDVLVPIVHEMELHELTVSVRAQRAAVLAIAGQLPEARAQIDAVRPYVGSGNPELREELARQIELVEGIASGRIQVPPPRKAVLPVPAGGGRVGRNQPCPCNSGRKFKHCCGRAGP